MYHERNKCMQYMYVCILKEWQTIICEINVCDMKENMCVCETEAERRV